MGCGLMLDIGWLLNRGLIKETAIMIELWNQCFILA